MKTPSYIPRSGYIEQILPFVKKNLIKVITGQRRVGKSFLMYQIIDVIKEKYPKSQIIYINKELNENNEIRNYKDLLDFIEKKRNKTQYLFLFIDEIQEIAEFEKALRSILAKGKTDIYCTGSNANLLSGELATLLSGRYIEIKVYGLSFREFMRFHKLKNREEAFRKYLQFGGLPHLRNFPLEDHIVYDYLRNIYNTIVLKDVVSRYSIRNVYFLDTLVHFLANNIGSLVSAKSISDFLKSQQTHISPQVVLNYLSNLCSSYLIRKVQRQEIKGRKIFEVGEKYFFEDIGIRNSLVGFKTTDIANILENIVYLHLKLAGYDVNIGKIGVNEIDFVAEKKGERIYVQVCYMLSGEDTVNREFGNLMLIDDNFPKYVVSMDSIQGSSTYKGIKHLHISDFIYNIDSIG